MENVTSSVATVEPIYWPDFGPLQYAEVMYMTIITVLGAIGNLIVIFSIALEKRVHAHGNIFIINLAVADFLVSSLVNPTVIAHIINGKDAIGVAFCDVIGYLVTSTCTCSLLNLMFIAINRYWAVVRPSTYQKAFRRKKVYYMMASTWIFSALVVSPTVLGWGRLGFDAKILVCLWDDTADYGYTWFITTLAVLMPMGIIGFCYVSLFRAVRGSGRWVRSLSVGSGISQQSDQHRRSMRKERSLLKTLITTVVLFCVCWVPFALCVLINPGSTPPHLKKIAGWLALTNSCVNFIIYGAMNPVFRRGYRNLFIFVFRCKRAQHVSSAMLHGSFSDSYRSRRAIKGMQVRNGSIGNDLSDLNRESSRNDSIAGIPIHTGDNRITDEDEFKQAHEMRYARRSQSELPPGKEENDNSNNISETAGIVLNVKGIASEYLRRSWMPDRAVYTSKQHTPVNGSINGSPNVSPSRKVDVVTVSNGLVHANQNQQEKSVEVVQNGGQPSPSKTLLTAAISDDADDSHDKDELEKILDNLSQIADGDVISSGAGNTYDSSDHDSGDDDAGESEVSERWN